MPCFIMKSTLVVSLLAISESAAFCTHTRGAFAPSPRVARSPTPLANEFDTWWDQRRARQIAAAAAAAANAAGQQAQQAAPAEARLGLDRDSVALVLSEFVQSDYAMQVFKHAGVQSVTDYGTIPGMFEMVQLIDAKVELKLKRSFEGSSLTLLDRCSKYMRARIPELREIHSVTRDGRDIW